VNRRARWLTQIYVTSTKVVEISGLNTGGMNRKSKLIVKITVV
jgi:hypothetical protein